MGSVGGGLINGGYGGGVSLMVANGGGGLING